MRTIWIVVFDKCDCVAGAMDKKRLPRFCERHGNEWSRWAKMYILAESRAWNRREPDWEKKWEGLVETVAQRTDQAKGEK